MDMELWNALQADVASEQDPVEVRVQGRESHPEVSLDEVLKRYDLVETHRGWPSEPGSPYIVVAEPKPIQLAGDPSMQELGYAQPSPYLSNIWREYNSEMRGLTGLRNIEKMRRGDATVRATLRLVKTPVLAARWFMEPASESTRDQNVANFVWKNLTEWMTISWPQVLTEALLMADYGYYMFEKVFDKGENVTADPDARGKVVWRKLAPRHPLDVVDWAYDKSGGPNAVEMLPNPADPSFNAVVIPIEKLLVFTFDKEGGDMSGISVLRSAYKHWYYKENLYKIDAIQKERHGIGVPIIKLPPNFNVNDRNLADEIGRNLRTNERAHVVLPPNWDIMFAKLEGQRVDALASAQHHDAMIEKNILASFMDAKSATTAAEESQTMFLKATRFIADVVQDVFNKHAIRQLVDYNWSRVGYPRLRARRIGESADWRTLSFAVRNLVGAQVIRPDDRLEDALREEMDLPRVDPSSVRVITNARLTVSEQGSGSPEEEIAGLTPPQAPDAGLPRQQALPPSGPPRSNAGTDRSGG